MIRTDQARTQADPVAILVAVIVPVVTIGAALRFGIEVLENELEIIKRERERD